MECVFRDKPIWLHGVQDCEGQKWLLQYTKEALWPQIDLRDRTLPVGWAL